MFISVSLAGSQRGPLKHLQGRAGPVRPRLVAGLWWRAVTGILSFLRRDIYLDSLRRDVGFLVNAAAAAASS